MNLYKSILVKLSLIFLILLFQSNLSFAQISTQQLGGSQINTITTAVPFLLISPDSRSGAMGDAGVAISPDANAIHWNPAKLVFIDPIKDVGFSMSYSPWLRALVNDINLAYLAFVLPAFVFAKDPVISRYWFFSLLIIYLVIYLRLYRLTKN